MIEHVSSHFRYTEEYVLDHSFQWLQRKFAQADREEYERTKSQSDEMMRGVVAALSIVFGGKSDDVQKVLLPPYGKHRENAQPPNGNWRQDQWWKKPS